WPCGRTPQPRPARGGSQMKVNRVPGFIVGPVSGGRFPFDFPRGLVHPPAPPHGPPPATERFRKSRRLLDPPVIELGGVDVYPRSPLIASSCRYDRGIGHRMIESEFSALGCECLSRCSPSLAQLTTESLTGVKEWQQKQSTIHRQFSLA